MFKKINLRVLVRRLATVGRRFGRWSGEKKSTAGPAEDSMEVDTAGGDDVEGRSVPRRPQSAPSA